MPETLPFRDMEGEDLATTVLTCEGDITDPTFPFKLQLLINKLQNLISDEENPIKVTKVEPWNSVRVTFNIPLEAAQRLRQLAERGDRVLRDLGILSVQIEGDQVITLTLASQYSEPQEIVLRKTSDEQGDVASISFNLPNAEPVPGPSTVEPTHKNISQFLGHIVGGAPASAAAVNPVRLEKTSSPKPESSISFRSPNVIAPSSTEPIPFPPSSVVTTTTAVTLPVPSRASPNVSVKPSSGFGPFPFASMTHAMNTKNSSTSPQYQPVIHVQGGNPRISFTSSTSQITNTILNSSASSSLSISSKVSNSATKVPKTITNSAFNSVVSRTPPPNAIATTSKAVALNSPLLVNLLQSETSNIQQNNKLMPPPSPASNQAVKRKRKPRKTKDKILDDDAASPSFSTSPSPPSYQSHAGVRSPGGFDPLSVLNQPINVPINNTISPPTTQLSSIHPLAQGQPPVSNIKPHASNIHSGVQGLLPVSLQSQIQGQPMVSTTRPIGHQTLSAFRQTQGPRTVPNIHPQAQGQPQVHTGNLPLHTHIPIDAPHLSRAQPGSMQSFAMSAPRTIPMNPNRSLFAGRDSSVVKVMEKANKDSAILKSDKSSAPSTPSTSTPDSNPFPSPPSSTDGKTKHLINPFTGQLEPMPSDEEEEEESISSLPPFPDFEETSEKSHSERSLSDGGKDNNLSSDTDSGISKSITDVSQSSTEGLTTEPGKDARKTETSSTKVDCVPTASVTSSVPGEKIKLRLKLDSKVIRESKENEVKDKRLKESNPSFNQKIDVAVVSIPGLKKNMAATSTSSVPEPRVPPLHISLRGPNAAVVVSPRKDDSKSKHAASKEDHSNTDASSKINQKKIRSPRATRTGDVSALSLSVSGRTVDTADKRVRGNNSKDFKKIKEDFWNQNVKNISMSGGGIVEVSEKVSSRISSYEAYLSGTSINNPVVQRKSSSIFSLSARDSCKSEIMTLTSCSTGESVTLHSFSGSRSPLPLQVSAVSETEALPVNVSQTIEMGVSSNNSSIMLPIERTEVIDKINNSSEEKPCEIPVPSGAEKDETLASSIKSPLMQNNYLPHSPSAPTDSKTVVQEINCPSDQTQSQSASSLKLESTVPLSLHSASSPTCNANETASNFSVQMQVSDSTDANRLPKPERVVANPLGNVSSSTDSQKLQNIHQCNINSDNKLTEKLDSVNIDERVQKEASVHETTSSCKENTTVNEVQKSVDVNKNATANRKESELCENVKNQSSHSSMPLPSHNDGDKCKNLLFSNHSESYDSSVSYLTPVPKKDNEFVEISDKNMCIAEMKKSPIAQIISADNLPIQPHVIEVPFQHSSLAVPNALAKSGCVAEISSVSSLIPSSGNTFVPVRNILVMHDTSNVAFCEGRSSDINIANTTSVISHSESFPVYTLPSKPETKIKLLNHIDIDMQESSNVKASSTPSSSNASEESSMDSIDEERKRCMQLSEIPTSTPGPPLTETSILNTDNLPKPLESSAEKNTCSTTIADKPVEPSGNENKPVSQKYESRNVPIEGQYAESSSVKDITPLVSQHSPLVAPSIQPPVLSNTTTTNEISSEEKISCSSSGIYIPTSSGLPLQKESQSESNANVLTSDSTPSVLVMQDPVPLVGLENRSLPTKLDVKKEPCSDSVHLISTPGNPVVTSLLSPVKYLPSEVGSQKFKLIFKGSGQRASLQSSNSPASLVVPLNSSKAVPIKFVTLPSASALSVRSTSNPNIVEIISPKASSSQNAPLSGTSHPSSPVRLVVSKVSPGLSCTNQSGTQNLRNRVVVKSVVMTGTSPSLKLVSTNSLCTSTAVLTNSGGITTSSTSQVVACPTSSSSSHVMRLFTDEMKPTTVVENSSMQLNSVCCLSEVTNVEVAELKNNKESNDGIKNLLKATSSAIKCSTSADSTTKDLPPSEPLVKNSVVNETVPINPMSADSSTFNSVVSPDTTTVSTTNNSENENIVSSNNELTTQVPSVENSECVSSEQVFNSTNNSCDNESNNKSAADTTSEIISVSSVVDDQKLDIKLESHINNEDKISLSSKQLAENDNAVLQTENCKNSVNSIIENSNNEYEINPRTVITSSESDDLIKSEQTADSAITTSLNYISNELESSDAADSSSIPNNPIFSDIENKQNIESVTVNLETSINNSVEIASVNPCEMENEVIIASNVEVGIAETSECAEISQNSELDCSDIKLEQSVAVETPKNELHNDSQVVLLPEDSDSLDEKCNVDMQKFRPLGDESIGVVDSTESDSTGVIIEDSQLEISLVYSKPLKRKCSENAAELIKACMGVEDCPKKAVLMKAKVAEEIVEKIENEKLEENVRMSLRIRKEDTNMKKPKGSTVNSDCSTDEEITLSELIKTRTREKPPRGRLSNRDSPVEPNNLKPGRRRSNSNESRNSEEIKTRAPRECKRETIKKNEPSKKLPERTKKGTLKAQDQVVISKVGVQRSGRIRDQEAAKANMLNNNKEESNSIGAKRKTRATAGKIQKNQKTIPQERRRSTRNAGSSKKTTLF